MESILFYQNCYHAWDEAHLSLSNKCRHHIPLVWFPPCCRLPMLRQLSVYSVAWNTVIDSALLIWICRSSYLRPTADYSRPQVQHIRRFKIRKSGLYRTFAFISPSEGSRPYC
jgi:hypothetical protein